MLYRSLAALFLVTASTPAIAQSQHHHPATARDSAKLPSLAGQDAFAAIAELVAILESDPATNWSTVNLEAVRRHLVDMNSVVLRATPHARSIRGGAVFRIEGPADVLPAVRRMVTMHAVELNRMPEWRATVADSARATYLTVVATSASDLRTVARIRALGFVGLLASGSHHQAHHLALARGQAAAHSGQH